MFRIPAVNDFQGLLTTDTSGIETLVVKTELKKGSDATVEVQNLTDRIKQTFEITAKVEVLVTGTLAKAFENSIKAPRFLDERE